MTAAEGIIIKGVGGAYTVDTGEVGHLGLSICYDIRFGEMYRIMALEACNPEELFSAEVGEIAERTLRSLPPLTYRVFALSRYDHLPVKEIAGITGLTPKSVEYHITRALKALRVALEGYLALLVVMMR